MRSFLSSTGDVEIVCAAAPVRRLDRAAVAVAQRAKPSETECAVSGFRSRSSTPCSSLALSPVR